MKREDILNKIREYTPEKEKEIVDFIMKINGEDINDSKAKISDLEKQVTNLTKDKNDLDVTYTDLKKEYDDFKDSKMTEEEKKKKLEEDSEKERKVILDTAKAEAEKYKKLSTEIKIKNVFAGAGFVEDDYKDVIPGLLLQDEEVAVKTATNFVNIIKAQKEVAAKDAVDKALNDIPDPKGNDKSKKKEPFVVPSVW